MATLTFKKDHAFYRIDEEFGENDVLRNNKRSISVFIFPIITAAAVKAFRRSEYSSNAQCL